MVDEVEVAVNHKITTKEFQLTVGPHQEGSVNPDLLSKWKKSAALFQPKGKNQFLADLNGKKNTWRQSTDIMVNDREVLDAAEALTYLSRGSSFKT